MTSPLDPAHLPYRDSDCVALFLEEMRHPPLWQCVHRDEFPHLPGFREMCSPEFVRCIVCAGLDLSEPCFSSCHCCGSQDGVTPVRLGVSTSGVHCVASLCGLCCSLVPPKK